MATRSIFLALIVLTIRCSMQRGKGFRYNSTGDAETRSSTRLGASVDDGTAVFASSLALDGAIGTNLVPFGITVLATALDQDMPL